MLQSFIKISKIGLGPMLNNMDTPQSPNKSLQPTPVGALVCSSHLSSGVAELGR
jgi:hypothetical protein